MEAAERPSVTSLSVSPAQTVSGSSQTPPAAPSPLALAKDELIQEVLRKLEYDTLEPLEGIRIMVDVRASESMERLCGIYNRLAGIERQRERAHRQGVRRRGPFMSMAPAPAVTAPTFVLGEKTGMDADRAEKEIKGTSGASASPVCESGCERHGVRSREADVGVSGVVACLGGYIRGGELQCVLLQQ